MNNEWSILYWFWTDDSYIMHRHGEFQIFNGYEPCKLCKKEPPDYILFQYQLLFPKNYDTMNENEIQFINEKYHFTYDIKNHYMERIIPISEYKKAHRLLGEYGF